MTGTYHVKSSTGTVHLAIGNSGYGSHITVCNGRHARGVTVTDAPLTCKHCVRQERAGVDHATLYGADEAATPAAASGPSEADIAEALRRLKIELESPAMAEALTTIAARLDVPAEPAPVAEAIVAAAVTPAADPVVAELERVDAYLAKVATAAAAVRDAEAELEARRAELSHEIAMASVVGKIGTRSIGRAAELSHARIAKILEARRTPPAATAAGMYHGSELESFLGRRDVHPQVILDARRRETHPDGGSRMDGPLLGA